MDAGLIAWLSTVGALTAAVARHILTTKRRVYRRLVREYREREELRQIDAWYAQVRARAGEQEIEWPE